MIRPIDIAKKLNITTSALRHYESWGIIPEVERGTNGYRIYTEVHVAYFECIRAMSTGFGMDIVRKVMKLMLENKVKEACWLINGVQVNLHHEKLSIERALQVLDVEVKEHEKLDLHPSTLNKKGYSISEAAKKLGVAHSTIRHWEKEGLIEPHRDAENSYRKYSSADLRKLLVIRTLRTAVYSLEIVRDVLAEIDHNNMTQARHLAQQSLLHIDNLIVEQLRGSYYLYKLYEKTNPSTSVR